LKKGYERDKRKSKMPRYRVQTHVRGILLFTFFWVTPMWENNNGEGRLLFS